MKKPVTWFQNNRPYMLSGKASNRESQCSNCAFLEFSVCPANDHGLICDEKDNRDKVWVVSDTNDLDKFAELKLEKGVKHDSGKPMYNLLPADALEEVVKVLTVGAMRYNEPINQENWRSVPNAQSRYFAAAQRHQWADQRGEFIDADTENSKGTDCYHLACAITSLLFKLQLRIEESRRKDKQ